jgi:ribonuclease R
MLSRQASFDKQVMNELIEEKLLRHLRQSDYRPQNKSELSRALELDSKDRPALRACLKRLEASGAIVRAKKGRYILQETSAQTVVGTFRKRPRGGELVIAKSAGEGPKVTLKRLNIPEGHESTALEGDRVLVRLRRPSASERDPAWLKHLPKDKQEKLRQRFQDEPPRLEGDVIKVLERSARKLVGTLTVGEGWATLAPDDERLPKRIDLHGIAVDESVSGHKALARIDSWESLGQSPQGTLLKVLGKHDAPGVDVLAIIHKHGLPTEFPEEVLQAAENIDGDLSEDALAGREDWRDAEVITIDPFDARDFDDAIAVKELKDGGWELAVHIADVSHYVTPGSELDQEAEQRGNSVYLVDRVLPMLPEALSNGICSLRPDEDRLTFCAIMTFDAKGAQQAARFTPAVIRSQQRLTYEEAYDRLQERGSTDPITACVQRAWALASLLRTRRFSAGSLDLDFPETKVILNDKGKPREIRVVENDKSHQLIEECMLAANEAVAETIQQAAKPSLYRIHEDPDPEKLLEFRESANRHGFPAGDLTHRANLQSLLKEIREHPAEYVLKLDLLKSMKRAAYHADSLGHYGLAKVHYTHFTSPIRRYSDLVVHRVLRRLIGQEDQTPTPSYREMGELGQHLSNTERLAAEAEQDTKRLKVMEYFERRSRDLPPPRFDIVVTEVSRMGLFVEILGFATRGLIRMADLPGEDYYRYDARQLCVSAKKGKSYHVGDQFEAELFRVNKKRGHLDLRPLK